MKDNILNIINNVSEKEFEEEFLKNGFEFEIIDSDENREDEEVFWNILFNVKKDNKEFSINISGTAIAEISYEKWVNSYFYSFEEKDVNIKEINMKNDILNIINNVSEKEFEEEFLKNNFEFEMIDSNENREGKDVFWNVFFNIKKENKEFLISISGIAIAEISYEKWIKTYSYTFDESNVNINEINKG